MLDEFRRSPPGKRFQRFYERKRSSTGGRVYRYAAMAAGVLLCLVGIFFLAVPGPGLPLILVGAALLAQQSRPVAKALDGAEVRLRGLFRSKARG